MAQLRDVLFVFAVCSHAARMSWKRRVIARSHRAADLVHPVPPTPCALAGAIKVRIPRRTLRGAERGLRCLREHSRARPRLCHGDC